MMDVSVFFRSKRVFWSWIFLPLVLRVVLMVVLAWMRQSPEEILRKEQALAAVVPVMEQAIESNRTIFKSYVGQALSTKERFLTDSADLLYKAGVQGSTDVSESMVSSLKKYEFRIDGTAPSLQHLSRFLADVWHVDYLVLKTGDITFRTTRDQSSYEFTLIFDRVELTNGAVL
jgi:hypothetical protein